MLVQQLSLVARALGQGRTSFRSYRMPDWSKQPTYPKYAVRFEESPVTSQRPEKDIADFYERAGLVVEGDHPPKPFLTFDEWIGHEYLKNVLLQKQWKYPTPIQSIAWPIAMRGRDLVANVRTGSGKTAAFVVPALQHISSQPIQRCTEGPIALVISPTRELAAQTCECFKVFGWPYFIKTALFCGGQSIQEQLTQAEKGVHVYAATPGRLIDLMKRKLVSMKRVTLAIIDEADMLLDMGFEDQLRAILSKLREDRQTSMWSATMPEELRTLASEYLKQPVYITERLQELSVNPDIIHEVHFVADSEKIKTFFSLLGNISMSSTNKLLVFCNRKDDCDLLYEVLRRRSVQVAVLHGNLQTSTRLSVLRSFHEGFYHAVVATDLASRGLDFKNVHTVINYDMPQNILNYVHRCGRTGRIGEKGRAITLFTRNDTAIAKSLLEYLRKAGQHESVSVLERLVSRR